MAIFVKRRGIVRRAITFEHESLEISLLARQEFYAEALDSRLKYKKVRKGQSGISSSISNLELFPEKYPETAYIKVKTAYIYVKNWLVSKGY